MDAAFKSRVSAVAGVMEHIWLRYEGAMLLLEQTEIPDPLGQVRKYAGMEANKARVHERFLEVTALLQLCLRDSEALEQLSKALGQLNPN